MKWDGPYRLSKLSQTGTSGDIEDLKTGRQLGRYAFNTLKVFVPREVSLVHPPREGDTVEWLSFNQGLGAMSGRVPRAVNLAM